MSRRVTGATGANSSARRRGTRAPDLGPLRPYDVSHMAATEPPEPDFVVQHLAARGEVSQLWGAPGVGKSMVVEACCGGVGHGAAVAGLECTPGKVLYLDAENGDYEVHRRVRNLDLPPGSVAIYDAGAAHLVDDEVYIRAAIDKEDPDLLVLDSLRRLTPGTDENDSGAMAEVIGIVKHLANEYDLAALLIHHARKDGAMERGSSAIKDQVSISWEMKRVPGSTDRHLRRLQNHKMRIGPEPDDRWLRIVWDHGVRIVEAEPPDDAPRLASGRVRDELAHRILDVLEGKKGDRKQLAHAVGTDPKNGTFRRALQDLLDGGVLDLRNGKYRTVPQPHSSVTAYLAPGTTRDSATSSASGDPVAPSVARQVVGGVP